MSVYTTFDLKRLIDFQKVLTLSVLVGVAGGGAALCGGTDCTGLAGLAAARCKEARFTLTISHTSSTL